LLQINAAAFAWNTFVEGTRIVIIADQRRPWLTIPINTRTDICAGITVVAFFEYSRTNTFDAFVCFGTGIRVTTFQFVERYIGANTFLIAKVKSTRLVVLAKLRLATLAASSFTKVAQSTRITITAAT